MQLNTNNHFTPKDSDGDRKSIAGHRDQQFSTFRIAGRTFGIDVIRVQEIVRPLPLTALPQAPNSVIGMINLRGQIATAISLPSLLNLEGHASDALFNVVCRCDGFLLSFMVDEIGDVQEFNTSTFELPPQTISPSIRKFMTGVFKSDSNIVSILDLDLILQHLRTL